MTPTRTPMVIRLIIKKIKNISQKGYIMNIPAGDLEVDYFSSLRQLIKDYLFDNFNLNVDVSLKVLNRRNHWFLADIHEDDLYSFLLSEFSILKTFNGFYYVGNTPFDEYLCRDFQMRIFDRYICADQKFDSIGGQTQLIENGMHYLTALTVDASFIKEIGARSIITLQTGTLFLTDGLYTLPTCCDFVYQTFLRKGEIKV